MIPILYASTETDFTSNGICRLAEATECTVTEVRNGEYELTLTYPITGKYFDQIQEGMYIAATHDDNDDRQAFCIYRRSAALNGLVQFYAHHISYLLNNIIVMPIEATSAADALTQMESRTVTENPFSMNASGVTTSGTVKTITPMSVRSVLGGVQGSVLDVFGGEYKWDMYEVWLYGQRGRDTDISIRYGKNLTNLNQTVDISRSYNAIVPYWLGQDSSGNELLVMLPEYYVAAQGITDPVMTTMDFSSEWQEAPTQAQLRTKATSYLSSNRPWVPNENIKISFVQLWQTEEYKDVASLQRLSLCDRVSVYYPALGVTAENVEIIKTVYNVLLDRYDEMELGDARSTFADTVIKPLGDALKTAAQTYATKSYAQRAIDHATQLITGGLGGHVVFVCDANGKPTEILVMDTDSTSTAQNVLRINVNGIGFSSTGINGPYRSAWTLDGQFVADFITAGTMVADRIKGGTLKLGGTSLGDGSLELYNASDVRVARWDKTGLYIGNIATNLSNPNFFIDTNGNMTAKNATLTGADVSGKVTTTWGNNKVVLDAANIKGFIGDSYVGELDLTGAYTDGTKNVALKANNTLYLYGKEIKFVDNNNVAIGYTGNLPVSPNHNYNIVIKNGLITGWQ